MKKKKVLIVDDHPIMAQALGSVLPEDFLVVVQNSTKAAKIEINNTHFNLVIVDYRLGDGSGLDVLRHLQQLGLNTPVILITSFEESGIFREAIKLGCLGLLLKTSGSERFLSCIEATMKGERFFDPRIQQIIFEQTLLSENQTGLNAITQREREVLELIGQGMNTAFIAQKLNISENTVESHRRHLLQKTGAKNSAELVKRAMENGWL